MLSNNSWQPMAAVALAVVLTAAPTFAQTPIAPAKVDAAIASSWTAAAPDWMARLKQDGLHAICSVTRNAPPKAEADKIAAEARASIRYPADGKLIGDWKRGEAIAQNGYGLRFTDTDKTRAIGGNCYACHQINTSELSYGTLGPSLAGYGRSRKFAEADIKAVYEKIYNSHAALPCSQMPRFGVSGTLTIEQVADLTALLMDPSSPVNK